MDIYSETIQRKNINHSHGGKKKNNSTATPLTQRKGSSHKVGAAVVFLHAVNERFIQRFRLVGTFPMFLYDK